MRQQEEFKSIMIKQALKKNMDFAAMMEGVDLALQFHPAVDMVLDHLDFIAGLPCSESGDPCPSCSAKVAATLFRTITIRGDHETKSGTAPLGANHHK